jgi:hypothetical protein
MIKFTKKKKYLIHTMEISQLERHKQFEIMLPANVKKITGVIISTART